MEKDSDGISRIKCHKKLGDNTVCNGFFDPKLKFRFGEELFNQKSNFHKYYDVNTSEINEIQLMSPTEVKKELLSICAKSDQQDKFDVEMFRFNYPEIFWSIIFFFDMNKINKSFMLPYKNKKRGIVIEKLKKINTSNNQIDFVNKFRDIPQLVGCNKNKIKISTKKKLNELDKKNIKNIFTIKRKLFYSDDLSEQHTHSIFGNKNGILSYKDYYAYEENMDYNSPIKLYYEKEKTSMRGSIAFLEQQNIIPHYFVKNKFFCYYGQRNTDGNMCNSLSRVSSIIPREEIRCVGNYCLIKKGNPLHDRCINFEDSDSDSEDVKTNENSNDKLS